MAFRLKRKERAALQKYLEKHPNAGKTRCAFDLFNFFFKSLLLPPRSPPSKPDFLFGSSSFTMITVDEEETRYMWKLWVEAVPDTLESDFVGVTREHINQISPSLSRVRFSPLLILNN